MLIVMTKIIVSSLCFLVLPLSAQQQSGKEPAVIRVSGEATISAKPDQSEINIGVVTQAPSADDAAGRNANEATAVIASLRNLLGPAADIRTLNYSLTPLQRYPKDGGAPTISGYSASNTVHVRTQNLAVVGKIIDTVTKSGANSIQGIQFTLRDDDPIRAQALKQAAQQARATGDALASALGLHVVRVLSVDTTGAPTPILPVPLAARAMAAATPIEAGTLDIRATVVVTLEVAPAM
jgi:uncharacterized protein